MSLRKTIKTNNSLGKVPCPNCERLQNGTLEVMLEVKYSDNNVHEDIEHRIVRCLGCDFIFYNRMSCHSEDFEIEEDEDGTLQQINAERHTYLPKMPRRAKPIWLNYTFRKKRGRLYNLLTDLYDLLLDEKTVFVAMGIRLAFDTVSEELGVGQELSFAEKIEALRSGGHISPREKALLDSLVNFGSAALHRGYIPSEEDLMKMMSALESFIHRTIVLPEDIDDLDQRIPTRT